MKATSSYAHAHIEEHVGHVRRLARRLARTKEDAEDIAQEALLRILKGQQALINRGRHEHLIQTDRELRISLTNAVEKVALNEGFCYGHESIEYVCPELVSTSGTVTMSAA